MIKRITGHEDRDGSVTLNSHIAAVAQQIEGKTHPDVIFIKGQRQKKK